VALDISKFLLRFVDEAREHLHQLNEGIALLTQQQADTEQVNSLFRAAHTLKGSSRMLKLEPITQTAHALEDLLSALRDGKLPLGAAGQADLLYQAVDQLTRMVDHLSETKASQSLPPADTRLCQALTEASQGRLEALPAAADQPPASEEVPKFVSTESNLKAAATVRIKLDRLDDLIKLMSEMVSSHAQMRELVRDAQSLKRQLEADAVPLAPKWDGFNRGLKETVQLQENLMLELHDKTLQLRMLPLSTLFDSAGRLVREMARSLGKQVECQIKGADIELDRQMIDQLADPIIHLLRNALDHGIETPEVRESKQKPAQGQLSLTAWQDGSWVVIEVSDDGQGIALEAVRKKALSKKLVTPEQLDGYTEQEVMELIFLPGFSTSALITDISGRGVGMDVVKKSVVDQLQGNLTIHSRPNQGSRFSLRLPLSLAVMRVLLVEVQGQKLGFTAQYVSELVRINKEQLLEVAERNAIILRNEFVPVLHLSELINLPQLAQVQRASRQEWLVLIVQVQHEKLALVIDELVDERDLVIKQLPEHLRHLPLISGMVTSGHQELVSLLHVPYLMEISRRARQPGLSAKTEQQSAKRLLVVDDSLNTREIERDLLEAYGYQVTLAEDGQQGLEKALLEDFDAVLTDVEMPVMDGFTLTARLRELEAYQSCPIIIITSREKDSDRRRGIQVGADAYIVKGSFDQNSLVETLQVLLG